MSSLAQNKLSTSRESVNVTFSLKFFKSIFAIFSFLQGKVCISIAVHRSAGQVVTVQQAAQQAQTVGQAGGVHQRTENDPIG